jgi:hypothetical protein
MKPVEFSAGFFRFKKQLLSTDIFGTLLNYSFKSIRKSSFVNEIRGG